MTDREWATVGGLIALLIVVVIVGIAVGKIDYTSVAISLITLLGGLLTGLVAKGRFGSAPPAREDEEVS